MCSGALNESVCKYLTCEGYWQTTDTEVWNFYWFPTELFFHLFAYTFCAQFPAVLVSSRFILHLFGDTFCRQFPAVLCYCWLGDRRDISPIKYCATYPKRASLPELVGRKPIHNQIMEMISKHTHTHTQPFYGSVDFVRYNPGELVPEETFTHSHLSWSSITPYLLHPSNMIHGILPVQSTCLTIFFHNLSPSFLWSASWPGTLHFIWYQSIEGKCQLVVCNTAYTFAVLLNTYLILSNICFFLELLFSYAEDCEICLLSWLLTTLVVQVEQ